MAYHRERDDGQDGRSQSQSSDSQTAPAARRAAQWKTSAQARATSQPYSLADERKPMRPSDLLSCSECRKRKVRCSFAPPLADRTARLTVYPHALPTPHATRPSATGKRLVPDVSSEESLTSATRTFAVILQQLASLAKNWPTCETMCKDSKVSWPPSTQNTLHNLWRIPTMR